FKFFPRIRSEPVLVYRTGFCFGGGCPSGGMRNFRTLRTPNSKGLGLEYAVAVIGVACVLQMDEQLELIEQLRAAVRHRHVSFLGMSFRSPSSAAIEWVQGGGCTVDSCEGTAHAIFPADVSVHGNVH